MPLHPKLLPLGEEQKKKRMGERGEERGSQKKRGKEKNPVFEPPRCNLISHRLSLRLFLR
jgi:hypothetical protein